MIEIIVIFFIWNIVLSILFSDVNIGEVSERGSSEGRIDVMHLVIVGAIAFLMGGVIFVGIFMYVQRYRKIRLEASERRKNQKNELNKNQIVSDNQLAMDFMNLNNKTFGGGTLTRDKMTVNEATATLKRNSVMRTNLSINDL